jgi:hypothetical protein
VIFDVSSAEIAHSLHGTVAGARTDAVFAARAISRLAHKAHQAREGLAEARERLSCDAPSAARQGEFVRLESLGYSHAELAELFDGEPGSDPDATAEENRTPNLPDADTLVDLIRAEGPEALDAYRPEIDRSTDAVSAAAWFGLSPASIQANRNRLRRDGSRAWPLPDENNQWTYRALVLHRASAPGHGGGQASPQNAELAGRIERILAGSPRPLTATEICAELGHAAFYPKVLHLLEQLARRGHALKIQPGGARFRAYWTLPGRGNLTAEKAGSPVAD